LVKITEHSFWLQIVLKGKHQEEVMLVRMNID